MDNVHNFGGDHEPQLVVVPRDLYYHEVAYVRGLEARVKELEAQTQTLKKLLAECQEAENERRYDAMMDDGRDFTPPYEP
jgi:hypothetical protein